MARGTRGNTYGQSAPQMQQQTSKLEASQEAKLVEEAIPVAGRPNVSPVDGTMTIADMFVSSSITASCDALRRRLYNITYNNSTEINSTIYFCRVPANNYNHSSNPTYLSASKIRVKDVASDTPVSYITTIGLYASDNTLMAVAKLSDPLKKDPTNQLTLRVRLDY